MKNLRILRAIILTTLCLALCASALVACEKNGNTETEQETTSATTEAEKTEQVEKFDYYNTDLSEFLTFDDSLYKDISISVSSSLLVTDEDVTEYIDNQRFQYKTKLNDGAQVTDQPIKLGDSAFIYYTGYLNGVEFEGGSNASSAAPHELSIGSGSFVPGFEEGLIGVIPANTSKENPVDVPVTFPENYYEDLAGKDVIFKVWVAYTVQYEIPEFTAEYITNTLKFSTQSEDVKAAYTEYVRQSLEKESEESTKNAVLSGILEKLAKEITVTTYPEEAVNYYYQQYLAEYKQYFSYYGTYYGYKTLEEFIPFLLGLSEGEDWEKYTLDMCRDSVKSDLIIYTVAQSESIGVTDEDYAKRIQYYVDYYAANGQSITAEQLVQQYGEDVIREDAHLNNIYEYLIDNASVSFDAE